MNINYHDLYHTVIKTRYDKEIVVDKNENFENDYLNYEDFIAPNHYLGKKHNNEISR